VKVATRYEGGKRFSGGEGASTVLMDAGQQHGGRGEAHTPKQIVLQGLAGCAGIDVVMILEKKRVPFDGLTIEVEADETKYHPVVFKKIHITYRARAPESSRAEIEHAIMLSERTFCGVSAMLKKTAEITWELFLETG